MFVGVGAFMCVYVHDTERLWVCAYFCVLYAYKCFYLCVRVYVCSHMRMCVYVWALSRIQRDCAWTHKLYAFVTIV